MRRAGQACREVVHQREEHRLLVREVVVDGALRRGRGADDVVHAGPVVAFAGEHLERADENLVACGSAR